MKTQSLRSRTAIAQALPLVLGALAGVACSEAPVDETASKSAELTESFQRQVVTGIPLARRVVERDLTLALRSDVLEAEPPYTLPYDYRQAGTLQPTEAPRLDPAGVVQVDLQTKRIREVVMDDLDLERVGLELARRGVNEPAGPNDLRDPEVEKGWGNGVDTRVRKGIADGYPASHNDLRRLGQLNNGCTGALIGRRLVLTAAHCVVPNNVNVMPTITYRARRDGDTAPYGAVTAVGYFTASKYISNDCNVTYNGSTFSKCAPHDWAVLILPSNAWQSGPSPGWMGFAKASESTLESWPVRNDGYPGCGHPESPAGCTSRTAYGNPFSGSIEGFLGEIDGYNTLFRFNLDMGRGHSGGPVYSYSPGSNGPYVLGEVIWQSCTTCTTASDSIKAYPNIARRMSPWLSNYLLDLRAQYP